MHRYYIVSEGTTGLKVFPQSELGKSIVLCHHMMLGRAVMENLLTRRVAF